jgi:hypothetical protein
MNMATTVWVASDTNPLAEGFNAVFGDIGIVIYTASAGPSFCIMMVL